jgi:hypothetical protein
MTQRTTASKEDIKAVEDRLTTRLDGIESRLGRLENLRMEKQKRTIENLKTRMKKLYEALTVSPHEKAAIPWRLLVTVHSGPVC